MYNNIKVIASPAECPGGQVVSRKIRGGHVPRRRRDSARLHARVCVHARVRACGVRVCVRACARVRRVSAGRSQIPVGLARTRYHQWLVVSLLTLLPEHHILTQGQ